MKSCNQSILDLPELGIEIWQPWPQIRSCSSMSSGPAKETTFQDIPAKMFHSKTSSDTEVNWENITTSSLVSHVSAFSKVDSKRTSKNELDKWIERQMESSRGKPEWGAEVLWSSWLERSGADCRGSACRRRRSASNASADSERFLPLTTWRTLWPWTICARAVRGKSVHATFTVRRKLISD